MAVPERQTDETLTRLLHEWQRVQGPAKDAVATQIQEIFEESRAIFVLDMSGFSETVIRYDILHFLAQIHQMRSAVVPVIERRGGQLVKFIGDDVVALFPDVERALQASAEIIAASRAEHAPQGPGTGFQAAVGIGYGPILHVPGRDVWGSEANAAFKLGEDITGPGQIMTTAAAYESLTEPERAGFEELRLEVSGVSLTAYLKLP